MTLRPVTRTGAQVPQYPGCENERRYRWWLGLLGTTTVTVPLCLVLLLANPRPAAAQDLPPKIGSGQENPPCAGKPMADPVRPSPVPVDRDPPCIGREKAPTTSMSVRDDPVATAPAGPPPCMGEPPGIPAGTPSSVTAPPAPPPCGGAPVPNPVLPAVQQTGVERLDPVQFVDLGTKQVGRHGSLTGTVFAGTVVDGRGCAWWLELETARTADGKPYGVPLAGQPQGLRAGQRVTVVGKVLETTLVSPDGAHCATACALEVNAVLPTPEPAKK